MNQQQHNFDEECECAICKNKVNYRAWEAEQKQQHGWYAHFVIDAKYMPYGVCFHTHGIKESFDHSDLQIVLNIDNKTAHGIFHDIVDKIKSGEKFEAGKKYSKILKDDYEVMFMNAIESNRDVLRIIFPDVNNKVSRHEIDKELVRQWEIQYV